MRVLVTGATGFTGGHLARTLAARGDHVRALVREPRRRATLDAAGIERSIGDSRGSGGARAAPSTASRSSTTSPRSTGRPGFRRRPIARSTPTAVGELVEAAAGAGVRRVVHCSTVGVHGDIEHPPANEDAPLRPGDIYQETKLEGERVAREAAARTGHRGDDRAAERHLRSRRSPAVQAVPRRRAAAICDARAAADIFYHLTYIDDLVEGFRLCGEVPAAANRTYILAGGEVTTLNELMAIDRRARRGVAPPRLRLPVWPFWLAGAACEAICAPLGIAPPLYRRRVDFFPKSRAFDISRARAELGFAPQVGLREGIARTLEWYREHGWL